METGASRVTEGFGINVGCDRRSPQLTLLASGTSDKDSWTSRVAAVSGWTNDRVC